ncbi:MAG: peptide deformylase [Deltaproteobacteria bacterium]|nr:MAG: peptide deformylase [Deltaproteobacteria bacterium]
MAILKVARMGHPVLRDVAKAVDPAELDSPHFQDFIDSLIETMREYDGVGLAAPQVHVSKRVVVMEVAGNPRYPDAPAAPLRVLVNPEIRFRTEERIRVFEGCLSIPDLRGQVPRCARIELRALDRTGREQRQELEGFPAAVVQHECDHLDGVLFVDRVEDTRTLAFLREFQRYGSDAS